MSRTWTLTGGSFVPDGFIPVTDRGLRYGMSVFETVCVIQGQPLFLSEHLDRLKEAGRAAGFIFPDELNVESLAQLVPDQETGLLRLYLSAGEGGPLDAVTESRAFFLFENSPLPSEKETEAGWKVGLSRASVPCVLGGWKTGNYWTNVQAMADSRKRGLQEALLCNAQGALASASMANVFVVLNGRILTPPLSMGARDGVIRSWVMSQVPVEEALLSVDDLTSIDEGFLTNSRIGVMPVSAIEEKSLSSMAIGRNLASLYREKVLCSR